MSDIVERVRQKGAICDCDILIEVATEIERLQMELSACGLDCEAYFNRCEELAAEIERQQAEAGVMVMGLANQKDEIERLRASNAELVEALKLAQQLIGHPDDGGSKLIAVTIAKAEGKTK